jgi:hypothetical protein
MVSGWGKGKSKGRSGGAGQEFFVEERKCKCVEIVTPFVPKSRKFQKPLFVFKES